jgi:hypothetical protein
VPPCDLPVDPVFSFSVISGVFLVDFREKV